jgi:hypothetical protein
MDGGKTSNPMTFGTSFLTDPGHFPDPTSGEPWGETDVGCRCAGMHFTFRGLTARQGAAWRRYLGPFADREGGGHGHRDGSATIDLFRRPASAFLHPPTAGWELWMDFDPRPEEVWAASLRMQLRLAWEPHLRSAVWTCVEEGTEWLGILENHLRVLVAYRLLEKGGALLHSSGVVDDGEALLFLGPSGAGKTTVARHSRATGRSVLSDDMNAVLPGSDAGGVQQRAVAARVPFAGEPALVAPSIGAEARFPLVHLVRLRKGPVNRKRPLATSAALATLAACAPFVNRDPHRQGTLLENLTAILQGTTPLELEFPREGGFWPLLREPAPPCMETP